MDQQSPTLWITGFFPNGFKASYTTPVDFENAYELGLSFTNNLLAKGFTTNEPGLNDGESSDAIITVMRRAKSDGTPIIDFFTDWGRAKEGKKPWGTFKYLHLYMNKDAPELVTEFLKYSGFNSLEQIPLYDAQAPLQRDQARPHAKETRVPTPFKIIREQGEEKIGSDGQPYRPWNFVRYEAIGGAAVDKSTGEITDKPAQPKADTDTTWSSNLETVKQLLSAVSLQSGMSANDILGAVNIVTGQMAAKWSEVKNITRSDVWASIVLTNANFDKAKALGVVGNDEPKRKAIEYWADKTGNIDF